MSATTLEDHLQAAIRRYVQAHPLSRSSHEHATAHLPGGNTRTVLHATPFPLNITSASGCTLTTADQHTYIDFLSEYTAGLFGHSNARIIDAVTRALREGYNFGAPNAYERRLASLLCARFHPVMQLVRFCNSGTEANMLAIAAAKHYTRRPDGCVLVFASGYHGSVLGFRADGGDEMALPHRFVVAPYDDIDGTRRALAALRDDELVAILVEPMQGSAGAVACAPAFLRFLRHAATARGAVLIVDEVMTSRLAYRGLAQDMGVRADLLTLGKWVGGGMTFGAFGGRRDIMQLFDPRHASLSHPGTFNNNIVSMAAGCEALRLYDASQIERLNRLGEELKDGVNRVLKRPLICAREIRMTGRGSILALRFGGGDAVGRFGGGGDAGADADGDADGDVDADVDADTLRTLFWHHMLDQGIYVAPRGFVALNVELTREHVARFVRAVETFATRYLVETENEEEGKRGAKL